MLSTEGMPATFNDEQLTAKLEKTFRRVFGDKQVTSPPPTMGGEDFSLYNVVGKVPCCMFRLGTIDARRLAGYERLKLEPPSLHSPLFYPDPEPTLRTGVIATCWGLLDLMPPAAAAK